ncbi:MAG: DUF5688 family protein [Eisenbergiella sp.]
MTFEEMEQTLCENLQNGYLPEQLIERLQSGWYEKGTARYRVLQLLLPKEEDGSRFELLVNLEGLYQKYGNLSGEEACKEVGRAIRQQLEQKSFQEIRQMREDLLHYEKMKPYLYVELYPVKQHREVQKGDPLKPIMGMEELALVPYVDLPGERRVRITKQLCENWGVTENELLQEAITSGEKRYPMEYHLYQMEEDGPKETTDLQETDMIAVTNTIGLNGAAALFYPGVLEAFGEKFGSLYFAPTSVNEIFLLPEKRMPDRMQREFDRFAFDIYQRTNMGERLLPHGYRYDAEKHVLETVADFQRRQISHRYEAEKQQTTKRNGPIL